MAIYRRSKTIDKVVYDSVFAGHFDKLIFLIVIEVYSSLLSFKSIFLQYPERNQIDISVKHRLEIIFDSLHFD